MIYKKIIYVKSLMNGDMKCWQVSWTMSLEKFVWYKSGES